MKVSELVAWGEKVIAASPAIDHWERLGDRHDAENLLRLILGEDLAPSAEVPAPARRRYAGLVRRRATGEPLSRIKGWISFRGLRIQVRPEVFVPRDSTEWLVEEALRRLKGKRDPVVVDVGTGAGPVPLAIAHEMPRALVIGTDISAPSIALARANARRLKLPARFVVGDLLSTLPGKIVGRVHVITANVPFIGRLELPDVADEIVKFEPLISLTDNSPHGLALMERLAATAQEWLRPGGSLLIEVASDRSRKVAALLRHAGYAEVKSTRGPMPWNRVVSGQRPARG